MIFNNNKLDDPLSGPELPLWAIKLNLHHHSPTQDNIPDGAWLMKYVILTQEERRLLPANAQMKAGVAVGDVLQQYYSDTIWKLNPLTKKLMPYANALQYADKQQLINDNLDKFRKYEPVDDKDREKFEKYQQEIIEIITNGFSALEEIGAANLGPITCEEQISIPQEKTKCNIPVVGRTDFTFGGVSADDGSQQSFPSLILELKTTYSKLGKVKKNGERSFISLSTPAAPSFSHLKQCAFYAARYDFKVPIKLLYVNKSGYKYFDSSNCNDLTQEGLEKNFRIMLSTFRRREKILGQFENKDANNIIKSAIEMIDPNFDHPFAWHNFGEEHLKRAKQLWNFT